VELVGLLAFFQAPLSPTTAFASDHFDLITALPTPAFRFQPLQYPMWASGKNWVSQHGCFRTCALPSLLGFLAGALIMNFWSVRREDLVQHHTQSASTYSGYFRRHDNTTAGDGQPSKELVLSHHVKGAAGGATGTSSSTTAVAPVADLPDFLKDTAIISMASGDVSGRQAIALFQSLRNVGTRVPNLVVLLARGGTGSANCNDAAWKKRNNRERVACHDKDTIAPEILSEEYIATLEKLGVQIRVVDPVPRNKYTHEIVGASAEGPQ